MKFAGRLDNNRADYDPNAGMQTHYKYRINMVDTELGGRIAVNYLATDRTWSTLSITFIGLKPSGYDSTIKLRC